jgi:hypothetical protein
MWRHILERKYGGYVRMTTNGKLSSTAEPEEWDALTVLVKSPRQTGILRRSIPNYSRNGIGERIAQRNLRTLLLGPITRFGGNVGKGIHGKRL